jgi:hypothetical protein
MDCGNKVNLILVHFLASISYKTFYINILNLSIQYFFSLKKPSSSTAPVLSVVTCWVHCSSNEIICPSDPPHREGDVSITGPNSIYFTLPSCGKHCVLGHASSVLWLFDRHGRSCNTELSMGLGSASRVFRCPCPLLILYDTVVLAKRCALV